MKRFTLAVCIVCVGACAQQAEPIDESERPAPPPAEGEVSEAAIEPEPEADAQPLDPRQTCEALLAAAREEDPEAFGAVATDAAIEAMSKNEKLTGSILRIMSEAECGEATLRGDSALIRVSRGTQSRDIPLTRVEGTWKFDGAAYLERYPMGGEAAPKKGKKGKRRKKRRRKG